MHDCYGFNPICYHILSTVTVCVVAIIRNMIAVATLIAITASVIFDTILSHVRLLIAYVYNHYYVMIAIAVCLIASDAAVVSD